MSTPVTEVWVRNPSSYINECVESGILNLVWHRQYLTRAERAGGKFDPANWVDAYYPRSADWRALIIDDQHAVEIGSGVPVDAPLAVYPTWEYAVGSAAELEDLLARPVGMIEGLCNNMAIPRSERPVLGQEHRVVITHLPPASTGAGRQFIRFLLGLQDEYPEAIVHIHGLWGWRSLFGYGWGSVDIDPRVLAQKGCVQLPMGKVITWDDAPKFQQWIHLLGFGTDDVKVPRKRCLFNIKSALWAAENFDQAIQFKSRGGGLDPMAITNRTATATTNLSPVQPGDKVTCDTCSLARSCKYFRTGEVCTLPGSETAPLAKFFRTRRSDDIIDGLGALMQANAKRLEMGGQNEELDQQLDPEVTKIIKNMFDSGVKLAKLVNPALAAAGAPRTNVLVTTSTETQSVGALTATVVAELEAAGHKREDITPEMLTDHLDKRSAAIPVVSYDANDH